MTQTEIDALKAIPIADFLQSRNVKSKTINGKVLFSAPYRNDPNPSMLIDSANRWHDFGTGEGGDIIDLVRKINNCDFHTAAQLLRVNTAPAMNIVKPTIPTPVHNSTSSMTILNVTPIWHKALLDYLQERNIDIDIAKRYCKQITYRANGSTYFGIGFRNNSGGYELRNKLFKGCTSKDITIINSNKSITSDSKCMVFEGFMDYLSHLTMLKHNVNPFPQNENNNTSYLILNSLSNISKAKAFIEKHPTVVLCLDNDSAGKQAVKVVGNMLKSGQQTLKDLSVVYAKHKDLNDYLKTLPKVKQSLSRGLRH